MSDTTILGYRSNGTPIVEKRGGISTRAFILCGRCNKVMNTHGGPSLGALCTTCLVPHTDVSFALGYLLGLYEQMKATPADLTLRTEYLVRSSDAIEMLIKRHDEVRSGK